VLALLVTVVTWVWGGPVGAARSEPRTTEAAPDLVDEVVESLTPGACRELVRAELLDGRHVRRGCDRARAQAVRALRRQAPRGAAFGVVERRRVDLFGVRLTLSAARRCRGWPLRSPGRTVLEPVDADRARCRLHRYQGLLRVTLVDSEGARYVGAVEARTDVDGRVTLRFADIDDELRSRGLPALDTFALLELGISGWAGVLDLGRMREFIADWHFEWVRKGRGSPALFAVRHENHPRAAAARALATEATLARHERDYLAVARGELLPRVFLARYAWSPYRRSVRTMATQPASSGTR
jgi:hypothetical protein